MIDKHLPLTSYPSYHPIHITQIFSYFHKKRSAIKDKTQNILSKLEFSYFDKCDIIIQCGTPVAWPNCYKCPWASRIWYEIIGRLKNKKLIFNIAAGSCYPWENQPELQNINCHDKKYLKDIIDFCDLTTTRDKIAKNIFENLCIKNIPILPCTALFAGKNQVNYEKENLIIINYMKGGGHFKWDQKIDDLVWQNKTNELIKRLENKHKLIFICHNEEDLKISKKLNSEIPAFMPRTAEEYVSLTSRASAAICNRMHASVFLAGIGIPSIAVCTDTRLYMIENIGLPNYYVNDVNVELLEYILEELVSKTKIEEERLMELKRISKISYQNYIEEHLNK